MLLGFDIGGTKCAVILGKESSHDIAIIDKRVLPTDKPVYEMIELLFKTAEALLKRKNITVDEISSIGISCGGPLSSERGMILSPPNLPGWINIPIVELCTKRFGKTTVLQNDANACAVAEWKFGAGRGYDNVIFLTFGTGMGAGLVLNGKLYSGKTDLAGEVGHIRLAEMGPVGFGKAGSFEGFCSGGGIAQIGQIKAREKLQLGETVTFCKSLEDISGITAKSIAEAAYAGDETAKEVYKICGYYLGRALSLFIDILNPDIIILGSIYGRARDLIDPSMLEVINKEAIPDSAKHCKITPAGLQESIGDYAALSLAMLATENQK
ncbi:MAG: ROK family protein [Chitinophagaceae bacterium]